MALFKRWLIVLVYATLETFILLLSTSYSATQPMFMRKYGISVQVYNLGASMNIVGNGVGLYLLGPISDVIGRKWIYVGGTATFAIFNLGLAYPLNYPMIVIFMFLAGVSGAPALSNIAATISDLFGFEIGAAQPMALFVVGGTVGPVLGSLIAYWILLANLGTKWIFLINTIIGAGMSVLLVFIPETLPSKTPSPMPGSEDSQINRINDTRDLQRPTKDLLEADIEQTPHDSLDRLNARSTLKFAATIIPRLYLQDPIVILLGVYNGIANGILLLFITGTVITYLSQKHLGIYHAEKNSLSALVAAILLFAFIPIQSLTYRYWKSRNNDRYSPEARFLTLLPLIWLFPASILWSAFTSGPGYSYWNQAVAVGIVAGVDSFLYLAQLNYITDCYGGIAGSAVAAFLIPSVVIQAVLAHLSTVIFDNMVLKWALAMLGFITLGFVVPGMYAIYFFGPNLRAKAKGGFAKRF